TKRSSPTSLRSCAKNNKPEFFVYVRETQAFFLKRGSLTLCKVPSRTLRLIVLLIVLNTGVSTINSNAHRCWNFQSADMGIFAARARAVLASSGRSPAEKHPPFGANSRDYPSQE